MSHSDAISDVIRRQVTRQMTSYDAGQREGQPDKFRCKSCKKWKKVFLLIYSGLKSEFLGQKLLKKCLNALSF
jgi:hypothetical protein